MKKLIELIKTNNLGDYKENISFKTLTTYKTGGVARLVYYPNKVNNLIKVLDYLKDNNIMFKIFGNGSNILASDNNYDGVIIKLNKLNECEENSTSVSVEAGYNFGLLCNKMCQKGYTGFEFGCGIPATVGGAVYMNAGAYLTDVSNILLKVDALDENFNLVTIETKDLDYSYRHSILMTKKYVVLKAYFKLEKGNKEEIIDLITDRKQRRITSQPLEYPSAGSVFRNPPGDYAGRLIESVGLKGKKYGGAMISDKHANFIINTGDAKSSDILYLIKLAKKEVKEKYDIDLYTEQELFNFGD